MSAMKPLHDGSAIYQKDSTWVCEHGVGYPDICKQCQVEGKEIMHRVFSELRSDLVLWWVLWGNR